MKNTLANILGTIVLATLYLLTVWALHRFYPMSFDHAVLIVILIMLAQVRWHQKDKKLFAE